MALGQYVTIQGSSFLLTAASLREMMLGKKVDRTEELPPTGVKVLFEVQGGRILLLNIVGEVTSAQLGAVASNCKLQANPTAAGSSVDLCAVSAIANTPLASLISITGTVGDVLQIGLAVVGMSKGMVVQAGSIDMNNTGAVGAGAIKWSLFYVPIDDDAVVVASYA